ncbi:MAG: nitroreductase [Firmicutes bacterium]|nr:nitroreductase [Bacillota bacterium]
MELIKGIKERRSIRKFLEQKVPREVIKEIVDAARFAPSWKNTQTARYIVIDSAEKIAEIAEESCMANFAYNSKVVANAPAVVVITYVKGIAGFDSDGTPSTKKGGGWQMFDAGIAAQTFCLAAHEKGLGTVIMGYFDEDEIKNVIDVPENQEVAAVIPIGYPNIEPQAPVRKETAEIITFI